MSIVEVCENPAASEATVNSASPNRKTLRRPSRSAARPPSRSRPPKVMEYAVITHCRFVSEKSSAVWIVGSATLVTVVSRTVMKKAAPTRASAIHRCGSSSFWLIASSWGAGTWAFSQL